MRDGGRELPDVGFRDDGVAGEGAVGIDAEDADVLADVGLAGAALEALAAGHVHLRADQVAFFDGGDAAAQPATAPENSWPGMSGRMDAAFAQGSQLKMWRSVPQTLAAWTRTSTSPGPGVGTGTSRSSMPGAALALTTACMVVGIA